MSDDKVTIDVYPQAAESLEKLLRRFLYKDDVNLTFMDCINLAPLYSKVSGKPERKLPNPGILLFKADKDGD